MKIEEKMAVAIQYELKNDQGEVLDKSDAGDPLYYLHGMGNLIPGLEKALEGKIVGDQLEVSVPPEEGYGEFEEELIQPLPIEMFEDVKNLQAGEELQAQEEDGTIRFFTVKEVKEDEVIIDSNHPLAGKTLHFKVKIEEIRPATAEEIEHGHVHSPGHHHH